MKGKLDFLTLREEQVFNLRFEKGFTRRRIADKYNTTVGRVLAVENKMILKIVRMFMNYEDAGKKMETLRKENEIYKRKIELMRVKKVFYFNKDDRKVHVKIV